MTEPYTPTSPTFFVNSSWWDAHPDLTVNAARSYGFNSVAVTDGGVDGPLNIVWDIIRDRPTT